MGSILIVEGPSDVQTLWFHGIPAIGLPSAAGWREEWASYFADIERIFVMVESDAGGEAVKRWLAQSSMRDRAYLVTLDGAKDVSELHVQDPARFRERLQAALDAAVPWRELEAADAQAETDEAWQQCEALATSPAILDAFIADLRRHGIAGEERFAKLVYLSTTSRFQPRPVSVAAKGPSAAGKSIVLQRTLDHFPPRAYYALSGMSERALAYSQEPVKHRMLVLYEAAGLQGDFASYLVRSLLSEGCIRYETVVKTEQGPAAVLIEREGPTGLLVTTTKILLHPENETRLLSVPVDDSPAQTRNVLREIARGRDGGVDFTRWHALQTWLQGAERRVIVPYAETLAEIIPPLAVRLRRDFGTLLALVRTHAFLHQATRARDDTGQVVATLTDYAVVRELVADLMAEGIDTSVPPIVRGTVEAVRELTAGVAGRTVTVKQVAQRLGIDSPPTLRRVRMAIERGYLKNEETRKGRPAQLVLGDPLPEDVALLPSSEDPRLAAFTVTCAPTPIQEAPAPEGDFNDVDDDSWPSEFSAAQDPEFVPNSVGNGNGQAENDWHDGADTVPDSDLWEELLPVAPPPLGRGRGPSE